VVVKDPLPLLADKCISRNIVTGLASRLTNHHTVSVQLFMVRESGRWVTVYQKGNNNNEGMYLFQVKGRDFRVTMKTKEAVETIVETRTQRMPLNQWCTVVVVLEKCDVKLYMKEEAGGKGGATTAADRRLRCVGTGSVQNKQLRSMLRQCKRGQPLNNGPLMVGDQHKGDQNQLGWMAHMVLDPTNAMKEPNDVVDSSHASSSPSTTPTTTPTTTLVHESPTHKRRQRQRRVSILSTQEKKKILLKTREIEKEKSKQNLKALKQQKQAELLAASQPTKDLTYLEGYENIAKEEYDTMIHDLDNRLDTHVKVIRQRRASYNVVKANVPTMTGTSNEEE
jgi:hypothetical protein